MYPPAPASVSSCAARVATPRPSADQVSRTPSASSPPVTIVALFIATCQGEQTSRGRVVSHWPQATLPRSLMLLLAQLNGGCRHARPVTTFAARNRGAASSQL